jgi:methylthioribose-1-phosphate isomerase
VPLNLPRTIEFAGGRVKLINQLKLPHALEFVETSDWRRVAESIRKMEIRGAPAIGVAAAFALALAAYHTRANTVEEAWKELELCADELRRTRPTAVNLFWAIACIMERAKGAGSVEELRNKVIEAALELQRIDEEANRKIGEYGESLIDDGDTVMTICNAGSLATSYYGTATAPLYAAFEKGKRFKVIALETRPYLQGARLTAWELHQAGIPVKIITDNAIGVVMQKERVDLVITGADRITRKGYVANKVGTYPLALMAKEHGIPFYVAAPTNTFDLTIKSGEEIPIEVRPGSEVTEIYGVRIAPEGVDALYYAFDVTPPKLVNGIITEKGIVYPPYEKSISKLFAFQQ